MSLKSVWYLVNDPEFRGRVSAAIYLAATDIVNSSDPETSARVKLAHTVRSQLSMMMDDFVWMVASNPSIAQVAEQGDSSIIPDGDIQYVVSSIWNMLAEIRYPVWVPDMGSLPVLPVIPPPANLNADGTPIEEVI